MKSATQRDQALRDGLRLKDREARDVDKLPRALAAKASAPILQPQTNTDK